MPVYNRETIVSTSVDSILSQRYTHFELICVDDCSQDKSNEILRAYTAKDPRVKLIRHEKNKGRSAARNTGIAAARGEWLCFLDSDDVYFDNHLSEHARLIKEHPGSNCFATGQLIYGQPKKYPFQLGEEVRTVKLHELITGNFISLNQLSIRRDRAPMFAPDNISYAEDLLYMRRVLQNNDLLLTGILTTDVLPFETRSLLTEKSTRIAHDNWAAAEVFCESATDKTLRKKILSHTALFCTSMLLTGRKIRESRFYFSKALRFGDTYLNPLFYKVLLKYLVAPFRK